MNPALMNILLAVLAALAPVITAVLSGALWQLWTKWGLQSVAVDKANMESELQTALSFAITKILPRIAAEGWASPGVQSMILSGAAGYLQQRFPDRSAKIAAAAGTVAATTAVTETLSARLPEAIAIAAASPGTPPASPDAMTIRPTGATA